MFIVLRLCIVLEKIWKVCNSFLNGSIHIIYFVHAKSGMLSKNNNLKVVSASSELSS